MVNPQRMNIRGELRKIVRAVASATEYLKRLAGPVEGCDVPPAGMRDASPRSIPDEQQVPISYTQAGDELFHSSNHFRNVNHKVVGK